MRSHRTLNFLEVKEIQLQGRRWGVVLAVVLGVVWGGVSAAWCCGVAFAFALCCCAWCRVCGVALVLCVASCWALGFSPVLFLSTVGGPVLVARWWRSSGGVAGCYCLLWVMGCCSVW
jgi:hypothetical protein